MPYFSDILIIFIGIISALIFNYLGTDKLFRFYFGLIMGFLLFMVFNLQIRLLELGGGINGGWETFLLGNKDFVLGFFSILIPVFGVVFTVVNSNLKSNKLFSSLFGFLLPLFFLGIFAYILLNSAVNLDFLKIIFGFFNNSSIFNFLQESPKLIFIFLTLILLGKYIFLIFLALVGYFGKLLVSEMKSFNLIKGNEEEKK